MLRIFYGTSLNMNLKIQCALDETMLGSNRRVHSTSVSDEQMMKGNFAGNVIT